VEVQDMSLIRRPSPFGDMRSLRHTRPHRIAITSTHEAPAVEATAAAEPDRELVAAH
jgi:hypothetical protein